MARYTGPKDRISRRFLTPLFGSSRALERRAYPPGQHGRLKQWGGNRESDYGRQLRAKQKARRVYGVLERQFRNYYKEALNRPGLTHLRS